MFETAELLGPTEKSIIVQTRKGTNIKNTVEPEPGFRERRRYQAVFDKFGNNWGERKTATGVYNCAGHVWASRRASLHDPKQWRVILADDGYRLLPQGEDPFPADLVLYVNEEDNEILHVGQILELRKGLTTNSSRKPWVLSKLDDQSGEVMHWVEDVLYGKQGFSFKIEYWTDRAIERETHHER